MSQSDDAKYLASLKKRYKKASKKARSKILDEYVQTTGHHRKHAIAVLSGKRIRVQRPIRRPRSVIYGAEDARALETLGDVFDGINSKLLRVALDNELEPLYQNGFLHVSPACHERLKHISPATMDRLRAQHGRRPVGRKSRSRTKPGTLLKDQIPIRTWAEWNEDRPGFTEMDLVAHDGGNPRGEHVWTLNFTDIKTGWTECAATRNKAQTHVFTAIRLVQRRLPFPLLGVDSTMATSSSTTNCFATARINTSPSLAGVWGTRTTTPTSNRKTGRSYGAMSATCASIRPPNSSCSTNCMNSCTSTSTSSCPS